MQRKEEFFEKEKEPKLINEREYQRPKSAYEKKEYGLEGDPLHEREVYQPARRQFERTLANYIEEATKDKHELTLEAWASAMLEANQKLSRLVRKTVDGVREEYKERPETVFNDFMAKARTRVNLPALWIGIYLEEGQEKLELSEPTYAARVEEIKARVKWQNDAYNRKKAKAEKKAEKVAKKKDMVAQGATEEQVKHQLRFRMNRKEVGTQTAPATEAKKVKESKEKETQTVEEAKQGAKGHSQKKTQATQIKQEPVKHTDKKARDEDSSSDGEDVTVIERKRKPKEAEASHDTGFEEEQVLSTDEEEELQARREALKKEAERKEAEAAAEEFKANLKLQKKRMEEKKAANERKAEQWNNFQLENNRYLEARDRQLSMRQEADQEERRAAQRPRITLEKPIYKARTIVTGYGHFPGNHYGLTQEEASYHDKARIATALTKKARGAECDQNVLDAWYNSDVRAMQRDMENPRHRLHEYTKKANWNIMEEGKCEPKPSSEDMQVVHYLFSFLNFEGIKRRLLELIEEDLFHSERLGQYMASSFRVGGKHLLHTFRCLWVHLYEYADFEMPAVHRDLAPQQ